MYNIHWYESAKKLILQKIRDIKIYVSKEDFVQEVMLALCEFDGSNPQIEKLDEAIKVARKKTDPTWRREDDDAYRVVEIPFPNEIIEKLDGEKIS